MNFINSFKKFTGILFGYSRELFWYLLHLAKKTSYTEYYADRMNRIVTKNPNWGLNLNRSFQLEYLKKQGLKPNSNLLDYGCGALSAGIHFIRFLDAERYTGLDISEKALSEGKNRLKHTDLLEKYSTLYLLDRNLDSVLTERKFDFLWAQSVLTHMKPEDIHIFLKNIRHHMHDQSQLFTSFAQTNGKPTQKRFKDWYYNYDFFIEAANTYDFNIEFMSDWNHPDDPNGNDVMARYTLKKLF